MNELDPRYPIGRFQWGEPIDSARRDGFIAEIEELPARLRDVTEGLIDDGWEARYRPEGWTIRQIIHHVADSHINAFVRFRLALTQEVPVIQTYHEGLWAELPDVQNTPPEVSLQLLEALHKRWADLLRALPDDMLQREVYHPDHDRNISLQEMLGLYAWHGRHHTAHVAAARARPA